MHASSGSGCMRLPRCTRQQQDARAGLGRWKVRHPAAAALLQVDDVGGDIGISAARHVDVGTTIAIEITGCDDPPGRITHTARIEARR